MDVDTMRKVDRMVGVPLCALSTALIGLGRRLFGKTRRAPKNALLIELSEMGSAILVDPAMREMKARGANLHFAIFAKNKPSLDLLRTVPEENIFTIRVDSLTTLIVDTLRFLVWCRRKHIDTVIDLELFSRYTALLAGWSGASTIVGFHRFHNEGLYRGEMLTRRVAYNPHVHITRNFFSLVHAAWAETDEVPFSKIRVPDEALTLARAVVSDASLQTAWAAVAGAAGVPAAELVGRPLVLVNANASDLLPQRRWDRASYAEVIRRLLAHRADALVLLTGSPGERAGLDELAAMVSDPRCINFAGHIGFHDLVALYTMSAVMLSNDSGPAHFASTTDMPTVVLFGPETPDLYRSLGDTEALYAGLHCSPCVSAWNHRKTACTDAHCLKAISVDQVFAAVCRRLDAVEAGENIETDRLVTEFLEQLMADDD